MIGWLMLWALLLSPMPLVLLLSLLGAIGRHHRHFFPPEYSGIFRLRNAGQLSIETEMGEKEDLLVTRVITLFNPLMVSIGTENGRTIRIWRDSCAETDYRHLLVVLRYLYRGIEE